MLLAEKVGDAGTEQPPDDAERRDWEQKPKAMRATGSEGWRLPGTKEKGMRSCHFLGVVLLKDPLCPEVPESIPNAREVGIRIVISEATIRPLGDWRSLQPYRVARIAQTDRTGSESS